MTTLKIRELKRTARQLLLGNYTILALVTNPATDRRDSQEAYRAKKEIAAGQQEGHQREYCVVSEQQLACCPFQFTYF